MQELMVIMACRSSWSSWHAGARGHHSMPNLGYALLRPVLLVCLSDCQWYLCMKGQCCEQDPRLWCSCVAGQLQCPHLSACTDSGFTTVSYACYNMRHKHEACLFQCCRIIWPVCNVFSFWCRCIHAGCLTVRSSTSEWCHMSDMSDKSDMTKDIMRANCMLTMGQLNDWLWVQH
jgi:hypothetical protein